MIGILKNYYRNLKKVFKKLKLYYSVNWTKTLYFNFKKFPFSIAKKMPVFFYGSVKFKSIAGQIEIIGNIKTGMIGFGQPYEMNTRHKGIAEINIEGNVIFKGHVQFGKDYFIFIGDEGYCEFGHMASLGSNSKLVCLDKVILGNYARFGSESQIIDTNFHPMFDTETQEKFDMNGSILIGNYNYIGSRVSVMKNTKTPNYCTIASNSLCNKDYTLYGNNILIGGIPSSLIRNNISRDWEGEREILDQSLIV